MNSYTEAVQKAMKGDQEAYTYLYEKTYTKCFYLAKKFLNSEHTAQDIVQDAYVKAFKSLNTLEDPEKFPSWIGTIVSNLSKNELKRRKVTLFSETENEDGQDISDTFVDDRVSVQPEIVMDQNETTRLMKEIIDTLTDEQRICVTMFYMEQMSVKEMASVLEVSENTVKSRLNYGRQKIKDKVLDLEKKGTKLYGLAPIPFSTFGNREQSNVGQNYLRSLFALGFQGFLIMICVGIYAVLVRSIAFTDDIIGSIWGVMGYTVLLCFTLFKTGTLAKSIFSAH